MAEDELAGKRLNRSHLRRGRGQPADSSAVSGHLLNKDASDDSLPLCQERTLWCSLPFGAPQAATSTIPPPPPSVKNAQKMRRFFRIYLILTVIAAIYMLTRLYAVIQYTVVQTV